MKNYFTIFLIPFFVLMTTISIAQSPICGYEIYISENQSDPNFNDYMNYVESQIAIAINPVQASGFNPPCSGMTTIPAIVTVIHDGPINSNYVTYTEIQDAINSTNAILSDACMELCLSQRLPDGSAFPNTAEIGVIRVDGSSITDYSSEGTNSSNEAIIKLLSGIDYDANEYMNIWVVREIENSLGTANVIGGKSSLFDSDPTTQGIILRDEIVVNNESDVIAHEMGHQFGLYHTFEGDNMGTSCPSNIDCSIEGDRCCDTDPHVRIFGSCTSATLNPCTGSNDNDYIKNFMAYSSCRDEFTDCQITRMNATLSAVHTGYLCPIACSAPCTDFDVDFSIDQQLIEGEGFTIKPVIIPSLSGNENYSWHINCDEISTDEELNYTLNSGRYRICLDVEIDGCLARHCEDIVVIGPNPCLNTPLDPCSNVINYDFDEINFTFPATSSEGGSPHDCFVSGALSSGGGTSEQNIDKQICNWQVLDPTASTGVDYFMMNGVTAVGMFGGTNGSSNVFENMISLEESSLLPDELYTVELKAMMTRRLANGSPDNGLIRIGFTSNPEQRTDVSDVEWVADFNVIESNKRESDIRNNCNLMKSDFQELNQTFEYKSSYGRYIVIFVDGDEGDAIRNYIIESLNFTQCCELDPSMSISGDCDNLSLVGENDGYGGTYTWTTGDGTTYRGSGPHQHNFLHPGDYEICMILSCDITHEQIELCEEYTVENMDGPCNSCMPGPPSIAIACQDDDGFDAEICFDLPEGTSSCTDDRSPHIFSDNGTVELNNWEPLDGSPILDQYCVSIHLSDITTPKKTVYFHACDAEGNRMCFSSVITPLQCTNCEETSIQSVAQCNRQMSTGTTNLYEGAVTIDLEPGQFICPESNVTTTTAGFSGNIIINTHNTVTIEYSITTNGIPSIPIEAILNICDDEAKPYCYRFTIIPEICPVIPEECIERWEPKQWECSLLSNGESVIEYEMFFKDIDYNVCPGGLVTAISGDASVEVVNVTSPQTGGNNNLLVQLNISIPCPDVQNAPYDLQLFLCNEEGGTVCFNIPIIPVNCCDEGESNGDTFNKAISRGDSSLGSEDFHFFPNPTQNDLTIIVSPTIIENVEKDIRINIIDQTGKLMINKSIRSTSEVLDITTLTNGIYLVHISTPDGVSAVKKLVVIK